MDEIIKMWEDKGFIVEENRYVWHISTYLLDTRILAFKIYLEGTIRFSPVSIYESLNNIENTRMLLKTMEFIEKEVQ